MLSFYSAICLRHVATGRYLASRTKRYRNTQGSSGQQMVFAVEKTSEESWWFVKPAHGTSEGDMTQSEILNGSTVRLEHKLTRKNLHSHGQYRSPLTGQQEATAFGSFGVGNQDDYWKIELPVNEQLRQGCKLILRHIQTDKVLHSHPNHANKELTDGEQEVTCFPRGDDNDFWELAEINAAPGRIVEPLISLFAEGRFGPVNLYSIDEFSLWFNIEVQAWTWIVSPLTQLRETCFTEVRNGLNQAIAARDRDDAPKAVEDLKKAAANVFETGKWLVSIEPRAIFVAKVVAQKGNLVGTSALAFLLRQPLAPTQTREAIEGAITAYVFEVGLAGVAASELESFKAARQAAVSEAEKLRAEREELNRHNTAILNEFAARTTQQMNETDEKTRAAFERVKNLEEVFHNKISIQSSVTYWRRKGWYNFGMACAFAVIGCVAGLSLYRYVTGLARDLLSADKLAVHDYWRFATLIIALTVAIWIGRLFVRLIFGNLHQWTDANERQTMIQTYIALRKEGYLPENKDVSLVLGVLFRPGDSGLLKEEKGPATPAELAVKLVDRDGS